MREINKKKNKNILIKSRSSTADLRSELSKTSDPALRGRLLKKIAELEALETPPAGFEQWLKRYRQMLWLKAYHPGSEKLPQLEQACGKWLGDEPNALQHLNNALAGLMRDGREPQQLPPTQTLYVAPSDAEAIELDRIGYPAISCHDSQALATFKGIDIVLTHPVLFSLAFDLNSERYLIQSVNCFAGNKLSVMTVVPPMTHLLTLAEIKDVNIYPECPNLHKSLPIYAAAEAGDWSTYQELAKEFIAA